jgi:hypothetical protein
MPPLRKSRVAAFLVLLVAMALPHAAAAQAGQPVDPPQLYELRTADGNVYIGRIISEEDGRLIFETITGIRMDVNAAFVRLRPARGRLVDGEFWATDRHTSRLFFAPTGRPVAAGDGYVGFFWVIPFVGYGASDNLTLAGGVPPVGDLSQTPVWLAPKVRVLNLPGTQASAGVFALHVPGDDCASWSATGGCIRGESSWAGVAYGIGTWGDDDVAVHAGAGITFGSGEFGGGLVPVMIGGERRIGRRTKLLTENWFIPGEGAAASAGWRRIGDRWTWDFGWMFVFGTGANEGLPYFPIVSFAYGFGGR